MDKDEFKDLKSLRRINLDGNQLSAVVDDLFRQQRSLEYLGKCAEVHSHVCTFAKPHMALNPSFADLSRNRIRNISKEAFSNLSNLTSLDISYNKLSSLELDYMCHLPKLHTLNISGNVQLNLWYLQAVFQNLTQLRSLSIADISNIPEDFFLPLANLQTLNVSGTRLGNETGLLLEPLKMLKVNPPFDIEFNYLRVP